jgi:hypothetical protein
VNEKKEDSDFEQLKLLFDLTKFHGTVYMAAIGLIAGVFGSKEGIVSYNKLLLAVALLCMLITGFAGAIVLKSICHARGLSEFWDKPIGPGEWELWPAKTWTRIERTWFWIGTVFALLAFVWPQLRHWN